MTQEQEFESEFFDLSQENETVVRDEIGNPPGDGNAVTKALIRKANRSLLYSVIWFLVGTAILYYHFDSRNPDFSLLVFDHELSVGWLGITMATFNLFDSTLKRFRAATTVK